MELFRETAADLFLKATGTHWSVALVSVFDAERRELDTQKSIDYIISLIGLLINN